MVHIDVDGACAGGADLGATTALVADDALGASVDAAAAADGDDVAGGGEAAAAASEPHAEQEMTPQYLPTADVEPQATTAENADAGTGGGDDTEEGGESTPEADTRSGSSNSMEEEAAALKEEDGDASTTETAVESADRLAGAAGLAAATITRVIVEALQERKDKLRDALTIPRCGHLCRFDAKVTPADQQCLEPTCSLHNLAVCATCSDNFHASGEMREHRQSVISTCPQCQLERSYYLCLDCDLTFCAPCFRVIHEPSKVQAHKTISMEGASASVLSAAKLSRAAQARIPQIIVADTAKAASTLSQTPQADSQENGSTVTPSTEAASACTQLSEAGLSASLAGLSQLTEAELPRTVGLQDDTVVGSKRKRDATDVLDVIMVDSDSDSDDRIVLEEAQVPQQYASTALSQQIRPGKTSFMLPTNNRASLSRMPEASQPQLQTAASQSLAIEPFNRGSQGRYIPMSPGMQNLGLHQVVSSDAYDTDSSSGIDGSSGVHASTPISSGIEEMAAPFVAPAPAAPPVTVPPYQQATDGWGVGNTGSSPMGMHYGRASNDFTADNGNPHDVPVAPTPAAVAPAGNSTLITTAADWTANPLEDILYDRYFQINLYTVNLEQHITRLNARIVQTSVENLAAAQQMTLTLRQQQGLLQKAQLKRTSALVALIVQSGSIMSKVKRLRMDMLSDIPQVPISSHRRCLELSQQITQYTSNIATLHQQMAVVLDSSGGMDQDTFHQNVSSINQALQLNEQSIQSWKEERENEIVRIVQYSNAVREDLKRTFHSQKPPSSTPLHQRQQGYPPHPPTTNGYYR